MNVPGKEAKQNETNLSSGVNIHSCNCWFTKMACPFYNDNLEKQSLPEPVYSEGWFKIIASYADQETASVPPKKKIVLISKPNSSCCQVYSFN
jgi:hypothetical protein